MQILSPRLVPDMDQLYEQWLQSQKPGWGEETSSNSVRENGKQIHMPTDYAEEVVSLKTQQMTQCFWSGKCIKSVCINNFILVAHDKML